VRKVRRGEILDLPRYEAARPVLRQRILGVKARRRVHLLGALTFLFENPETIRHQVHEMIRAERLVREDQVRRELDTYNELLGGPGELGATLLIEIDDPEERKGKLTAWRALPERLYALLEDGRCVRPRFDERQRDRARLSAVQFLAFAVGGEVPVALGSDLPGLSGEARLTEDQRAALREDLAAPE
jgi:hypothetical protein